MMVGAPKKKGRPGKKSLGEGPLADVNPKPSKRGRPKKIKVIKKETLSQPESQTNQEPPAQKQEEVFAGPTELPAPASTPVVKRGRGIRKSGTTAAGGGGPKKVGVKGHHRNKDHIGIRDCIPDEIILPEELIGFEHVEIFDGNCYLENNPRNQLLEGLGGWKACSKNCAYDVGGYQLRENVVLFQMCPVKAEEVEEMETIDSQATQNLFL